MCRGGAARRSANVRTQITGMARARIVLRAFSPPPQLQAAHRQQYQRQNQAVIGEA